jgi:hypothetical protein
MGSARVSCLLGVGLALACVCVATAQGPTPAPRGTVAPSAAGKPDLERLKGTWIRLEGGYIIAIKGIGPRGELDAMYFNPNPLPFSKAQAAPDGATFRLFFELRAGGYGGSTYELTYDPASDRLKGSYYQAVAKQRFDVSFARK